MLEVAELRSGYGRLEILQGVSLRLEPGAIVGVIGPNGAGKSTLLKTVFGYLESWAGSIRFEGRSLIGLRPDQVMRLGVGFVAQAGGLFADMTVHENLALGGYRLSSRREQQAALEIVYEQFPLFRARRRQPAGSLSGGEQRALALARALVTRPGLLLLDEPSAALAPRFIEEVYATIARVNRAGIALLIVEQNVEMILSVAHRVFVLDLGRNAFDGAPAELRGSDRIRRLYLGEGGEPTTSVSENSSCGR
jgi:ABC-type branched-subunit amino acid transport system ATPase component